ncbi:hypothetical protein DR950_33795 [Kitasatospora xanthocidica]|uniref:Uncharacterized protein n=1 Tax=Kitasatospora xanthocidica TaxID=83382 RepID=A0A373A359_9ACTN|nr:hypothetical protein DR950_33795 [Kitasatospora xanthocidica]
MTGGLVGVGFGPGVGLTSPVGDGDGFGTQALGPPVGDGVPTDGAVCTWVTVTVTVGTGAGVPCSPGCDGRAGAGLSSEATGTASAAGAASMAGVRVGSAGAGVGSAGAVGASVPSCTGDAVRLGATGVWADWAPGAGEAAGRLITSVPVMNPAPARPTAARVRRSRRRVTARRGRRAPSSAGASAGVVSFVIGLSPSSGRGFAAPGWQDQPRTKQT